MPDFEIRACTRADLPAVAGLLRQLSEVAEPGSDFRLDALEQLFHEMAEAPEFYLNLVAEAEGAPAGFISVIFYKTLFHRGGTALINELVVDETQRGRGIGSALIREAIAAAHARGMDEIEVATEPDNVAARRFYQRQGFDGEYILFGMEFH